MKVEEVEHGHDSRLRNAGQSGTQERHLRLVAALHPRHLPCQSRSPLSQVNTLLPTTNELECPPPSF